MRTSAGALAILVAALLFAGSAIAESLALEEVREAALVNVLGYAEEIVEARAPGSANDLPVYLRLFRVSAPGECDGAPETCPTEFLYLVVSPLGENETRRLYRLPDAYGWTFVGWSDATTDGDAVEIIGTLDRRVVAPDPATGWRSMERYELHVSMSGDAVSTMLQPVE